VRLREHPKIQYLGAVKVRLGKKRGFLTDVNLIEPMKLSYKQRDGGESVFLMESIARIALSPPGCTKQNQAIIGRPKREVGEIDF